MRGKDTQIRVCPYFWAPGGQLYAAEGAGNIGTAGAHRQLHPSFTQTGEDREGDADQYITNMRNDCVAGFKYFDLRETDGITIQVRGAAGTMRVWDQIGGKLLSEIDLDASESYREYSAQLTGGTEHCALFFQAETKDSIDFASFTLYARGEIEP